MSTTDTSSKDNQPSKKDEKKNTEQGNNTQAKIDLDALRNSEGFRNLGDQFDYWSD